MSIWSRCLPAAILSVLLAGKTVLACSMCGHTPCRIEITPVLKFACVTEMVPVTVMKAKTKVDFVPVCTKTIMETKIDTVYDEQTRNVCKPVFETVFEDRYTIVCHPVCETSTVCQSYTVCRPVTTTHYVTEHCLKPYTELVAAACGTGCGHVGGSGGACYKTVTRICYKRVPVVREVTETHLVSEVHTQMVPTVRWRTVTEQKVEKVPVTTCRIVNDVVRIKVPRLVFRHEPKTLVYKTAVLTCEEVPVTVYRPVVKMVPVVEPSPQALPSSQAVTSPSKKPMMIGD